MTATISTISRDEIARLISSKAWGNISEAQSGNLKRWLKSTTMMWAGRINGRLVCVFGVVPPTVIADTAYLWLWETDQVKGNEFIFVRKSQIVIRELLQRWPRLVGMCKCDAERSQRWLRWLGARLGEPRDGFVPFVIGGT